jgi:hypothetical protein
VSEVLTTTQKAAHPFSLLNRAQKQVFFNELQMVLGQIVEDEVVFDLFAQMLDNQRLPSQVIRSLSDIIGDVPASYAVNWWAYE